MKSIKASHVVEVEAIDTATSRPPRDQRNPALPNESAKKIRRLSMFSKTKIALAAALVLGSASLALADEYTSDAMRNYGPVAEQTLNTRQVALPHAAVKAPTAQSEQWMDRASQNVDGGGN
jgi:hypothetical protein